MEFNFFFNVEAGLKLLTTTRIVITIDVVGWACNWNAHHAELVAGAA
jgi:hypothetical protein